MSHEGQRHEGQRHEGQRDEGQRHEGQRDAQRMTVDEIELNADNERIAVLIGDDGTRLTLPLALLPDGTQEGDVINLALARDSDETERRRKKVGDLQKKLFGDR